MDGFDEALMVDSSNRKVMMDSKVTVRFHPCILQCPSPHHVLFRTSCQQHPRKTSSVFRLKHSPPESPTRNPSFSVCHTNDYDFKCSATHNPTNLVNPKKRHSIQNRPNPKHRIKNNSPIKTCATPPAAPAKSSLNVCLAPPPSCCSTASPISFSPRLSSQIQQIHRSTVEAVLAVLAVLAGKKKI